MKFKRRRFPRSLTAAATAALRRPRYRVTETLQHSRPNPVVILNVIVDDRPADYNTTSSQAMRVASTITFIRSLWTSLFVCPKNQYYHHSSPRRDSIVLSALLPLLCYLLVIKIAMSLLSSSPRSSLKSLVLALITTNIVVALPQIDPGLGEKDVTYSVDFITPGRRNNAATKENQESHRWNCSILPF